MNKNTNLIKTHLITNKTMTKVVHKDISKGFIMSYINKVPLRA